MGCRPARWHVSKPVIGNSPEAESNLGPISDGICKIHNRAIRSARIFREQEEIVDINYTRIFSRLDNGAEGNKIN